MDITEENKVNTDKVYPYWFSIQASNRLEFAEIAMQLFNFKQIQIGSTRILQERHIKLMAYFLVYGYSNETRDIYMRVYNYKKATVVQLCSYLSKNRYIVRDDRNYKIYRLSKVMTDMSKFVNKMIPPDYVKSFGFLIKE